MRAFIHAQLDAAQMAHAVFTEQALNLITQSAEGVKSREAVIRLRYFLTGY
jgi:hypothetical protein